ncbi:MAG: hypothetical protein WC073_08660 [Sterolibacterium sp.]
MAAAQNYRLLQELDANRRFMLLAYRDNPVLLVKAEERIKMLLSSTEKTKAQMPKAAPAIIVPVKEPV